MFPIRSFHVESQPAGSPGGDRTPWNPYGARRRIFFVDRVGSDSLPRESRKVSPVYNLFISGHTDAWKSDVYELELGRCLREYTETELTQKYGELTDDNKKSLMRLPCIFAYEQGWRIDPKFGLIEEIQRRAGGNVRIWYKLIELEQFISHEQLEQLSLELDIGRWELNRTHWALKDVNLAKELHRAHGIKLPDWAGRTHRIPDLATMQFDVALSFPGESRDYVEQVARELEAILGPNRYFYDNNYIAQLARPSLDQLLQNIYRKQSDLIVVFLSGDYNKKEWCGLEFRVVREIIMERKHDRVMYVKLDDAPVEGVLKTDGYVDARKFSPKEVATFIAQRVDVLRGQ